MSLPIPFGNPATYPGHSGVDYGQPRGTAFRASGSGVVTWLGSNSGGGNFIWVKYDAIVPKVGYHHMDSHNGCPREGARFNEGDILGYVGNTGNSTGPHLHSEVDGHRTTAGYWQFFDASRVVGGSGGGGSAGGPSIGAIQEWLNGNLNAGLAVDGIDGPATQAAVKRYQGILGINQDGIWGAGTEAAHREQHPANHLYGGAWVRIIQEKANRLGANLAVDGLDGEGTQAWVRQFQVANGLTVDGIAGTDTNAKLDELLTSDAPLTVDGDWGPATTKALQKALGVTQDGEIGPATTAALQTAFGIPVDGEWGPQTTRALQTWLGVTADGEIGMETTRALQTALNAGKAFTKVTLPAEPDPAPAATPRTPVYPGAVRGWNAPLASARSKGVAIEWLIIHHQGSTDDDEGFFKTANSRGSCPTWQVKANGDAVEFIPPNLKPSSSGEANDRSVAIETQNTSGNVSGTDREKGVDWGISDNSHEQIALIAAWLSQQTQINGVRIAVTLDRDHIFGDKEITAKTGIPVRATLCPGPSMDIDRIIARAKEIVAQTMPEPEPEPEPGPATIQVELAWARSVVDYLNKAFEAK